jgi:hypothetical protein
MPRYGTLFGTKRFFEAKRADKHAVLRFDLRHNNIFSGERTAKCAALPDIPQYNHLTIPYFNLRFPNELLTKHSTQPVTPAQPHHSLLPSETTLSCLMIPA